jgi:hypothetical protein
MGCIKSVCESIYIAPRKKENQNQKKFFLTKNTHRLKDLCESKYIIAPKKKESQNQKKNSLTQTQIKDDEKEKERT